MMKIRKSGLQSPNAKQDASITYAHDGYHNALQNTFPALVRETQPRFRLSLPDVMVPALRVRGGGGGGGGGGSERANSRPSSALEACSSCSSCSCSNCSCLPPGEPSAGVSAGHGFDSIFHHSEHGNETLEDSGSQCSAGNSIQGGSSYSDQGNEMLQDSGSHSPSGHSTPEESRDISGRNVVQEYPPKGYFRYPFGMDNGQLALWRPYQENESKRTDYIEPQNTSIVDMLMQDELSRGYPGPSFDDNRSFQDSNTDGDSDQESQNFDEDHESPEIDAESNREIKFNSERIQRSHSSKGGMIDDDLSREPQRQRNEVGERGSALRNEIDHYPVRSQRSFINEGRLSNDTLNKHFSRYSSGKGRRDDGPHDDPDHYSARSLRYRSSQKIIKDDHRHEPREERSGEGGRVYVVLDETDGYPVRSQRSTTNKRRLSSDSFHERLSRYSLGKGRREDRPRGDPDHYSTRSLRYRSSQKSMKDDICRESPEEQSGDRGHVYCIMHEGADEYPVKLQRSHASVRSMREDGFLRGSQRRRSGEEERDYIMEDSNYYEPRPHKSSASEKIRLESDSFARDSSKYSIGKSRQANGHNDDHVPARPQRSYVNEKSGLENEESPRYPSGTDKQDAKYSDEPEYYSMRTQKSCTSERSLRDVHSFRESQSHRSGEGKRIYIVDDSDYPLKSNKSYANERTKLQSDSFDDHPSRYSTERGRRVYGTFEVADSAHITRPQRFNGSEIMPDTNSFIRPRRSTGEGDRINGPEEEEDVCESMCPMRTEPDDSRMRRSVGDEGRSSTKVDSGDGCPPQCGGLQTPSVCPSTCSSVKATPEIANAERRKSDPEPQPPAKTSVSTDAKASCPFTQTCEQEGVCPEIAGGDTCVKKEEPPKAKPSCSGACKPKEKNCCQKLLSCCLPKKGENCKTCMGRKFQQMPYRVNRVQPRGFLRFLPS